MLVRARLNGHGRHPVGIGVFDAARFFYFTGAHVRGMPTTIEERQAELDEVLERFLPKPTVPEMSARPAAPVDLDDRALLDKAMSASNGAEFAALYAGQWEGRFETQSQADQSLCNRIAWWTGPDPDRIDRLFRGSGLYRSKWDRENYSVPTIEKAIASCNGSFYEPATRARRSANEAKEQRTSRIEDGDTTAKPTPSGDLISPLSLISPIDTHWPKPITEDALHGVVGDYVTLVDPHTEADQVAVLLQTLVLCGNAIGRRPYVPVEADRHHVNLDGVLIGDTSKARKGTAYGHAHRLVTEADPEWATKIVHGLSSGEGLIHAVRDPRHETGDDGEPKLIDAGVSDKRLQVVEPEFVSVLKVASRDGSTLTAMLRQAWDSGDLRTLTRKDPLAATGAHVSLCGHITVEELRRYLDATEAANGFGNRILWACVRRSKSLPEGGHVPDDELRRHTARLAEALDFARRQDEVSRDHDARRLWADEYERLAQGQPGLVGALLARAEAQVLRLALLYALLDRSSQIRVDHLRAALALWDYCEASVRHVFGDSTGNPDADQIIVALRRTQHGLTKTEISNVFGRHLSAGRIGRALLTLNERGLAYFETEETGGRPVERWHAYAKEAKQAKEVRA